MIQKKITFRGSKNRLDKFLGESNKNISRSVLQKLIHQGEVFVNGKKILKKDYRLKSGDIVNFDYQKPKLLPDKSIFFDIVFENKDLLVINKPAGIVVHPIFSQKRVSVAAGLLAQIKNISKVGGDEFRPGIVHRLDADTSGLMVVAKTQEAFDYLKKLFQDREIEKKYFALVHGEVFSKHGVFDLPIGRRAGQSKFCVGTGREAKTEYWQEKNYNDGVDKYTLVKIQLHTGRTHQIRVHFSSAGFPVAGDKLYGGKYKKTDLKKFPRQFLHSYYLKFRLPSREIREFEIDLPKDLKQVLKQLKQV